MINANNLAAFLYVDGKIVFKVVGSVEVCRKGKDALYEFEVGLIDELIELLEFKLEDGGKL